MRLEYDILIRKDGSVQITGGKPESILVLI
jgi:hypothetical protein